MMFDSDFSYIHMIIEAGVLVLLCFYSQIVTFQYLESQIF